LNVKLIFQIWW